MIGFDSIIEDLKIDNLSEILHNFLSNENKNETLYSLDRKEGNIAILENRNTGEISSVSTEKLPNDAKDGDIFKLFNDEFIFSEKDYKEVYEEIDTLRKDVTKN